MESSVVGTCPVTSFCYRVLTRSRHLDLHQQHHTVVESGLSWHCLEQLQIEAKISLVSLPEDYSFAFLPSAELPHLSIVSIVSASISEYSRDLSIYSALFLAEFPSFLILDKPGA